MRLFEDVVAELRAKVFEYKAPATRVEFVHVTEKFLLPYFSGKTLDEIEGLWEAYLGEQKKQNPYRKRRVDRKIMIRVLRYAFKKKLIPAVPELELDPYDRAEKEVQTIDELQYKKLLAHANERWKDVLFVLWNTGMRIGEVRLMEKAHIDWDKRTIYIPERSAKTRKERTFPVSPRVLSRLREICEKTPRSRFVFPGNYSDDRPMSASQKTWQRIKKRAGVKTHLHAYKHTFVTSALRKLYPTSTVGKYVGTSAALIHKRYHHPTMEDLRELAV